MKIWDLLEVGLGILLEDYNQQQYVLLQRDEYTSCKYKEERQTIENVERRDTKRYDR